MVNNIPMRLQKCDFTYIFYGFRTLGDANEIMDWLSNQSKTLTILWWANEVEGTVYPKKKYSLVQDMGVHMLATFRLTEVDVIDAD